LGPRLGGLALEGARALLLGRRPPRAGQAEGGARALRARRRALARLRADELLRRAGERAPPRLARGRRPGETPRRARPSPRQEPGAPGRRRGDGGRLRPRAP